VATIGTEKIKHNEQEIDHWVEFYLSHGFKTGILGLRHHQHNISDR
jgi:hypothetical protein